MVCFNLLKRLWPCCLTLIFAPIVAAQTRPADPDGPTRLRVADDHRHLARADGQPFFYLGDTAWELFHRLSREDATFYLENRAKKGFTVIQAVLLSEFNGLDQPDAYGHRPLINQDPTRPAIVDGPANDYWDHVDFVVDKAAALGLYIGMLPTWGDKWAKKWGQGPEVFTPENARQYGQWLGRRYRERPIIWILGGDRSPENDRHLAIIRALAAGLADGDSHSHLMTFHPQGEARSSKWFHKDDWLDFNAFQSGHARRDLPNYEFLLADRALTLPKPTLDAEPRYEDHPINWDPKNGWFDEADVRQAAYWSMLAGACGHTYGDHDIWQFLSPANPPVSHARTPWKTAIDHPASFQVGYMRKLFESRPWTKLVPDQSLLATDPGQGGEHIRAARADDGRFAFIYTPTGKPLPVNLSKLKSARVVAWWFDPRKGTSTRIDEFPTAQPHTFDPPGDPARGNDWVLVLDDPAAKFPPPGAKP